MVLLLKLRVTCACYFLPIFMKGKENHSLKINIVFLTFLQLILSGVSENVQCSNGETSITKSYQNCRIMRLEKNISQNVRKNDGNLKKN